MDQKLKQRLLGTAVIVSLVVIFVPMLFTEEIEEPDGQEWQIPKVPEQFESNMLPLPTEKFETNLLPLPTEPLEIETSAAVPLAMPPAADTSTIELREASPKEAYQAQPEPQPRAKEEYRAQPQPQAKEEFSAQPQPQVEEKKPKVTASPKSKPKTQPTATPAQPAIVKNQQHNKPNLSAWAIQVGSFRRKGNANAFRNKLRTAGFTAFSESVPARNGTMYRVLVGPELDKKRAVAKQAQLKKQFDLQGIIVRYSGSQGSDIVK